MSLSLIELKGEIGFIVLPRLQRLSHSIPRIKGDQISKQIDSKHLATTLPPFDRLLREINDLEL
jgi:hypothetical protein